MGEPVEGMFDGGNEPGLPRAMFFAAGGPGSRDIPWTAINWVRKDPVSSVDAEVQGAHAGIFAMDAPEVIQGFSSGINGIPGSDLFVIVPVGEKTASDWIERFRQARVEIKG